MEKRSTRNKLIILGFIVGFFITSLLTIKLFGPDDEPKSIAETEPIAISTLIFDDVDDPSLYKKMLVICADETEIQAFLVDSRGYNYRKTNRRGYKLLAAKNESDKKIYIVNRRRINSVPKQEYGIIQLKGHNSEVHTAIKEMIDIVIAKKNDLVSDEKTVMLIGGCDTHSMGQVANLVGAIPIGTVHIGQSRQNDYFSLHLHSKLTRMSLYLALEEIKRDAPAMYPQYVIPQITR